MNRLFYSQDQLGRPKRRGYLSADGFTFGRPNERRDNSAGDGEKHSDTRESDHSYMHLSKDE